MEREKEMTNDEAIQQIKEWIMILKRTESRKVKYLDIEAFNMAIAALMSIAAIYPQNKQPCEYCGTKMSKNGFGRTFYTELPHDYGHSLACLAHDEEGWVIHFQRAEEEEEMRDVKIAGCPMCLRKFGSTKCDT